ncbi:M23 family metallopeptidase [Candidatus Kaiserbacteria bacterium]|nr:MAG: M23 family metallopeptidase [Candidatus Kaiserbacteria bacterium]
MTYTHTYQLVLELGLLVLAVVIPFSVHAGVFSAFFDTVSAETKEPVVYSQNQNAQVMPLLRAALNIDPNPEKDTEDILVEDGALVPSGDIDGKDNTVNLQTMNGEINLYVVREGDTLSQIAEMFDVSAKTILWANDISSPSKIRPGDSLIILPITGVRHIVKKGDTLASIAKKYAGDIDDILAYNQLASAEDVNVGDTVVVPGGVMAQPTPTKKANPSRTKGTTVATGSGSAGYAHPLPGAVRTQGLHGYNGIDFGASAGAPIYAAAAGEVIVSKSSGYNGGYGLYVVIKHANGTQTLYAHNSRNAVGVGDTVAAGDVVGYVGSTGRSTGNHLHFEVRGARNPF